MTEKPMRGYSPFAAGAPEPPTPQHVVERQRQALREIRRILTDMNGCLDYLDVLSRIDAAVSAGLGEKR